VVTGQLGIEFAFHIVFFMFGYLELVKPLFLCTDVGKMALVFLLGGLLL
jgi:hypothetical protein